jgi:hypothetical protein
MVIFIIDIGLDLVWSGGGAGRHEVIAVVKVVILAGMALALTTQPYN